jgi:hypothetical protein
MSRTEFLQRFETAVPRRERPRINGRAKLTPDHVARIRSALDDGVPARIIANLFGVRKTTIRNIRRGVSWRDV